MKSNRHIIASIFLVMFSFIQLADLHVLDHDANDIDCTICQFASQDQNNEFVNSETVEIPNAICIPADIVRISYEQKYFDSSNKHSFLNKAPPAA